MNWRDLAVLGILKMFTTQEHVYSWQEFELISLDFLKTEERYLFLVGDSDLREKILSFDDVSLPDLDLIQFFDLHLLEKGELGIREIHWRISNLLTESSVIVLLMGALVRVQVKLAKKIHTRYIFMLRRKRSLMSLMRQFALLGIAIPHYIEPRESPLVMSRSFVRDLLEFNTAGELSLERAFFALARTANYKCVRISKCF
jgi:hypothetical protein